MPAEQTTIYGPFTTALAPYIGPWVNTFDSGPNDGWDLHILMTAVIGNPNLFFRVAFSADGVSVLSGGTWDPMGPINTLGERNIHFTNAMQNGSNYFRIEAYPNQNPSGLTSGFSSSLSSQTFNSSSSGGSYSATWTAYLSVSPNG